jgi:hypothetical protein
MNLPALASNLNWSIDYRSTSIAIVVSLAGDFNRDGRVDTGDYVWWRKFDGNPASLNTWRSNFGNAVPAVAAAAAVPEPNLAVLIGVLALTAIGIRYNRD